jgi:hypothetical protein
LGRSPKVLPADLGRTGQLAERRILRIHDNFSYCNQVYIMIFDKMAPFIRHIVIGDYLVQVVEFCEKVLFNEAELT